MRERFSALWSLIKEKKILPPLCFAAVIFAAIFLVGRVQSAVLSAIAALLIAFGLFDRYLRRETKALDELNETLIHEREIRQEFFANASHELKTPITSIRGYAELMENDMVPDEEMQKDMIRRIRSEAERMTALISDILAVSKLEAHDVKPELMEVNMTELIADRIAAFEPKAQEARVTLCNYSLNHVHVYADYGQMEEIVSNLISNAIRYNRPRGKVWVIANNDNGYMVLRVRDSGIGMAEEETKKIFNRFYRIDKGRSRETGGTGLGLSIVKHIVVNYGGTIEVTSKLGEGSTFIVRIPESTV